MAIELVSGSFREARLQRSLTSILGTNVLASFATVTGRRLAHANTAYFAWSRDLALYWYSYPTSRHSRNLAVNRSMAVTVFDSHQRWGGLDRGLQMFGSAGEAVGADESRAERVYARRFPGFVQWRAKTERDEGAFPLRPYRFRPRRIVLFDERMLGGGKFVRVEVGPRTRL